MKYLSLFVAALIFVSCNAQEAQKVQELDKKEAASPAATQLAKNISAADFKAAVEAAGPEVQLVDVRTPENGPKVPSKEPIKSIGMTRPLTKILKD